MVKKALSLVLAMLTLVLCLSSCSKGFAPNDTTIDVALLEFPGLKWNSSINDVKKALNLTDEQILADEQATYTEDYGYEIWNLLVADIQFLGCDAEKVQFMFIRYPGRNFGLTQIELTFSGNWDMNTLKDKLTEVYGEGSGQPAPLYRMNEEGYLETINIDSNSVPNNAPGFPYYWFSTVKGTDVLSSTAQERYIDYWISTSPGINPEAVREYLEKTSAVTITCMDWLDNETSKIMFDASSFTHNLQQFEE